MSTVLLATAACNGGLGSTAADNGAESWQPDKAIHIIVGADPGGGFDLAARTFQKTAEATGVVDQPITVSYKPGVGGTLAWSALERHNGDAHYLAMSSPSPLVHNVLGTAAATTADVTPLATLYNEYITFAVRPDSPIKDARDLVDRLKGDPSSLAIGIATSLGNHNHMALAQAMHAAGVDIESLKTVAFDSGSDARAALLSGDIDLVPAPVGNFADLVKADKVKAIAVSSPERLGGSMASVPTWAEQGIDGDATFTNWRGMVGPKGLSKAQKAYWDKTLTKLSKTEEWKTALQKNLFGTGYRSSAATKKFLDKKESQYMSLLTRLGMKQQ